MALGRAVKLWPTPSICGNYNRKGASQNSGDGLATAVNRDANEIPPSISSQGDFLANLTALPGSAGARAMTARSGRKCAALLRTAGPIGCLLKTCLESSRWNSTVCWLTWKPSVTPRGRLLFRLAPSMPGIGANEFGLLATPHATQRETNQENYEWNEKGFFRLKDGRKKTTTIQDQVKMWSTPTTLAGGPEPEGETGRKLTTVVGGQLNPNWVEWLMGYPVGHTACEDWATPSSRKLQKSSFA